MEPRKNFVLSALPTATIQKPSQIGFWGGHFGSEYRRHQIYQKFNFPVTTGPLRVIFSSFCLGVSNTPGFWEWFFIPLVLWCQNGSGPPVKFTLPKLFRPPKINAGFFLLKLYLLDFSLFLWFWNGKNDLLFIIFDNSCRRSRPFQLRVSRGRPGKVTVFPCALNFCWCRQKLKGVQNSILYVLALVVRDPVLIELFSRLRFG